jgi:hypothetical protein
MVLTGENLSGSLSSVSLPIENFSAEKLIYSDSDENGYIDTLSVYYPFFLTGVVHVDSILLYSQTG